jgi:dolichyl-diphosphooligosaccharide--protein glycosyltransferase
MGIKETLSKKRVADSVGVFGKLRVQLSHGSILSLSALSLILFIAFAIRILPMRWEIPGGTLGLSEFDPFYYYTITSHMVQYGLLSPYYPTQWIDTQLWYPFGFNMGSSSLPTLPLVTASTYNALSFIGVRIDLMSYCSFLPVLFGVAAVLVIYFIGKDLGGKPVGLLAALFLALAPTFIEKSNLGWYGTEEVGILGLLIFVLLFMRAIEEDRPLLSTLTYSIAAGFAFVFFAGGWGAAYYVLGLVAVFVLVLILLRRTSHNLLWAYSISFGLGLFLTVNIPYLNFTYLFTAPVLAVTGVWALLWFTEIWHFGASARSKILIITALLAALVGSFAFLYAKGLVTAIASKFYSVIEPYARSSNPILASVAEHAVSSWGDIYIEFGIIILFSLLGLYFVVKNPTNKNIFLLIFGLTSIYFAMSMVRLIVILDPALGLLAAMGIMGILKPFYTLLLEAPRVTAKAKRGLNRVSREYSGIAIFLIFIILVTNLALSPQSGGQPRVYASVYTPITISSASLPVVPTGGPVPEWKDMLAYTRTNLSPTTVVSSWWDYGLWLSIGGNVTTLCDNTTENTTQIENVGFSMMANQTQSLNMLQHYNASYVLVFVTVALASSSTQSGYYTANFAGYGDEGKWSWMAQISGGAHDRLVQEGFISENDSWTTQSAQTAFGGYSNVTNSFQWNDKGLNSTIYLLMEWAKDQWALNQGQYGVLPDSSVVQPQYFNLTYCAGSTLSPLIAQQQYGGLVPLVALYQINWQKYYNDTKPATG